MKNQDIQTVKSFLRKAMTPNLAELRGTNLHFYILFIEERIQLFQLFINPKLPEGQDNLLFPEVLQALSNQPSMLSWAAKAKDEAMMALLLAQPKQQNNLLSREAFTNKTPLHHLKEKLSPKQLKLSALFQAHVKLFCEEALKAQDEMTFQALLKQHREAGAEISPQDAGAYYFNEKMKMLIESVEILPMNGISNIVEATIEEYSNPAMNDTPLERFIKSENNIPLIEKMRTEVQDIQQKATDEGKTLLAFCEWLKRNEISQKSHKILLEHDLDVGKKEDPDKKAKNLAQYPPISDEDITVLKEAASLKILCSKTEEIMTKLAKYPYGMVYASGCTNLDLVKSLIKRGADVNAQDSFLFTPLIFAIDDNQRQIIDYLLSQDTIDISLVSVYGHNALIHATMLGDYITVEALLARPECKIDHKFRGKTALEWAREYRHHGRQSERLLENHIKTKKISSVMTVANEAAFMALPNYASHTSRATLSFVEVDNKKELPFAPGERPKMLIS